MKTGRPPLGSYVVLRGGKPCALVGRGVLHAGGLLVPADLDAGEKIADFVINRKERFGRVSAQRRAISAIKRTHKFCHLLSKPSLVDDQHLAKRVCAATGDWSIKPILA